MSESRDSTGDVFDDKEGKMMKDSDAQQEAASTEGRSASSSTPLEGTATETEGSKPSGEGNVDLPFHKLTLSQSKSGGGSFPFSLPEIAILGEFKRMGHFLFELQLTGSDVERGSLSIPSQTASFHFPSTFLLSNYENQIVISDTQNNIWYMKLTYNDLEERAFKFAITSGWQGFVDWHGLKPTDVIHFYSPLPRLHEKHYLIDYVKAEGHGEAGDDADFYRRIFLFEVQLTPSDVVHGRLFIPVQRAAKHFPPIPTHNPDYEYQIEISDSQNYNWYMTLIYNSLESAFIVTRGWHRFVVRHNLEAMDTICFYKHPLRLHNRHFLIEHVKGGEAETVTENPNPPEFKPENFLFDLQLTSRYVSHNWLKLPKEEVRNHFPAIVVPDGTRKMERLNFTDAQNKGWSMRIAFSEEIDAYMIVDGWEGFVNKHRLESMDAIRFYKPVKPLHCRHFLIECVKRKEAAINEGVGRFNWGIFLFEVQLTRSDVERGRLSIPVDRAVRHFPPLATTEPNYEQQIEISDSEKDNRYMTLTYNSLEYAFVITGGWQGFVDLHSLKARDVICFYRPFPRLHNEHFLIKYVKGEEAETDDIHEFKQENFLFQLQLSPRDVVRYSGLIIPKEEVKNHFPAIYVPAGTHKLERLIFTDVQNKDWCMKIVFDIDFDDYMIIDGWEGFVDEHNLEAMNVIRFYKPVRPLHQRHFLIECVKREAAAAGTSQTDQLGGARKDGNGGDSAKGGDGKQGDGGGQSHGSSRRHKGKAVSCWSWKNQRGGRERAIMSALEEFLQLTDGDWEETPIALNQ